ncbi:Segregation and condensation protein A [hydrothermal vent metagenome]|uniref:Segregation and condensation protein A n=1 Tax=hydrothermal vent metagenome TaxID=652676 RepID=A0A3B1A1A8_9ZZZZ
MTNTVENSEAETAVENTTVPAVESTEAAVQSNGQQSEMPFAVVQGTAINTLPQDLYIPPDALEVFLAETFEGPLDLLLYLIKKQNLEILDLPIAEITRQYVEYVEVMTEIQLELAGEYLVMAAMLAEIKSRMLLPQPKTEEEEEGDPRAELVRRLQEYERFKQAAEDIDNLPRVGRDTYKPTVQIPDLRIVKEPPKVDMKDILAAFNNVMKRVAAYKHHHIDLEPLSVRERMSNVLDSVRGDAYVDFGDLFDVKEGKSGVVVTLLAILELVKQALIELVQTEAYAVIHVKAISAANDAELS